MMPVTLNKKKDFEEIADELMNPKLVVKIGSLELSEKEARKLYDKLKEIFDKDAPVIIKTQPLGCPCGRGTGQPWNWPTVVWSSTSNNEEVSYDN